MNAKRPKVKKETQEAFMPLMLPAPSRYRMAMYEYNKYKAIKELGLLKKVDLLEVDPEGNFTKVGEKEIAGIQAMLPNAFVIRVWEDIESKEAMISSQKRIESWVREELPGFSIMPSHPGWIGRTKSGDGAYYEVLVSSAERRDDRNKANSRLTRLTGHLDWRSRYIGTARVRILRTDLFCDYDGWGLIRPGFISMPWDAVKVYGTDKMCPAYVNGGSVTVKGMTESNPVMWKKACKALKIKADSVDVIIPEISLKFDDGRDSFDVELFTVFENTLGEHMTITLQMLMNLDLTEEAEVWAARRMAERFSMVRTAFEDPTGISITRLLASESDSLSQFLDDDYCDSEVEESRETMTSTLARIVSGIPFENSKYLKAVLPDVFRMLKRFTIKGVSDTALPDSGLKEKEITISKRVWKAFKRQGILLKIGDQLLVARHPVTGTEVCLCTIVGIGRTGINPAWWAKRFAGDFDGDRIAFGYLGDQGISTFTDESKIEYIEEVETQKADLDVYEANAAGWYSQAMVPTADRYLRIAREGGKPTMALRRLLQDVIDSSKHTRIINIDEALKSAGLTPGCQASSLVRIMSGSFGSKATSLMNYNRFVHMAKTEKSAIRWMNIVRKSGCLFNLFSGTGDSDYSTNAMNVIKNNLTKGATYNLVSQYASALKAAGLDYLTDIDINKEPMAAIPKEILNTQRGQALIEKSRGIPLHSKLMARTLVANYLKFISNISSGVVSTSDAYQPVRDSVIMLKDSEFGPDALKWLFISLAYAADTSIKMKALGILSYMPLKLGSYNIVKILEFLGYERKFDVIVK